MMNLQVRKGSSMLLEFCHCGTFKKKRQNLGWAHSLRLEFYTWFNKLVPRNQVYIHKKASNGNISYWHQYAQEQIQVGLQIVHLLIQQYNIQYILGHSQIATNRKLDPGPAFPMHQFQKLLP
jgi:hypothetical protein